MSLQQWHILDQGACLTRLESRHLGRVAFLDDAAGRPTILPINYLMVDGSVVFRTDAGSKLDAAQRGTVLAFEIDGFDELDQTGWSVLVRGHAGVVTDEADLDRLRQLPLVTWAPGAKPFYVRIDAAEVTGRRISAAELPSHWWG
jgi:uncharacterized protein